MAHFLLLPVMWMYWDLGITISLKLWHNLEAEITMAFKTEEIRVQLRVPGELGSGWTVHTRERRLMHSTPAARTLAS